MATRFRWNGLIPAIAILAVAWPAFADQPQPVAPQENPAAELAPHQVLDQVIQEWQLAQSKIHRLDARFTYICYDKVFQVAQIGDGLVSVDRDGRAFFQIKGRKSEPGTKYKDHFIAKPASDEKWHWTEHSIYKVDDRTRQYEQVEIPLKDRPMAGQQTLNSRPAAPPLPEDVSTLSPRRLAELANPAPAPPPLPEDVPVVAKSSPPRWSWFPVLIELPLPRPFLLDTHADRLQKNFKLTLTQQTTPEWIRLEAVPLRRQSQANYSKAFLILNRADYQLKALKLEDTTGNRSCVYVFSDVRINHAPNAPFGDLGEPDLRGYKKLNHP